MSERKTDEPGHIVQAGVIAFRVRPDGLVQVALVTSRSGGWIVPKGHVEDDQTPEQAALAEAFEEAGLLGKILAGVLGDYDYEKLGTKRRVTMFAMRVDRVLAKWPEMSERRREWVSVDEAIRRVPHPGLRDVLERFEVQGLLRAG